MTKLLSRAAAFPLALALGFSASACGDTDAAGNAAPSVVVTTNILGDVVSEIVGDGVEVTTIMPVGIDPHDFQPSAQHAATIRSADVVVINGGGFEEGLGDIVEGAEEEGVTVIEALDFVDVIDGDPHFFTDPARMAAAVKGISATIVEEVGDADAAAIEAATRDFVEQLEKLDTDIAAQLSAVPPDDRVMVTNHEVFAYFADRYGFEIVGTVVPGGTTSGGSARELRDLVEVIRTNRVAAIFADTSSPDELAQTLAAEVGDVDVVELFSESLGPAGSGGSTYLEMMTTNADRIVEALAPA